MNGSKRSSELLHCKELQVLDCSCRWAKGCLESVDWITTGLEHWNGLNCGKMPFS